MYTYADGGVRSVEAHHGKNIRRVFIDGRYAGTSRLLGIPGGNYKSADILRKLVPEYNNLDRLHRGIRPGFVYVIKTPAYPEWCKVGMTVDLDKRLASYQTGSPFRDYELVASKKVEDRRAAEAELFATLEAVWPRRGEWINAPAELVVPYLQ